MPLRQVGVLLSCRVHGLKEALVKVAAYDADAFSRDTRKAWLQLEWAPKPVAL